MDLKFSMNEVKSLILATVKEKDHRLTLGQRYDPSHAKAGVKMNKEGFLDDGDIDFSKVKPSLWLEKCPKVRLLSSAINFNEDGLVRDVKPLEYVEISGVEQTLNLVTPELNTESIELDETFVEAIKSCHARTFIIKISDGELEVGVEN